MSAGLVLAALAMLVAPWSGVAATRLRGVVPSGPGTLGADHRGPSAGGHGVGSSWSPGPGPGAEPGGRGSTGPTDPVARLAAAAGITDPRALLAGLVPRRAPAASPELLARLLDLLGVALVAGMPAGAALDATADALEPGTTSTGDDAAVLALRAAASRMRLGADPGRSWDAIPGAAALAPVLPVLTGAFAGGGSARAALDHAARRLRSDAEAADVARAERAGVLVAGPLGLCFLPAFVCLGIVPVVIGLADGMLPGVLP